MDIMFIKTTFKDSNKVKRIRNYVLISAIYICIFDITQTIKQNSKNVSRNLYIFWVFFR